MVDEWYLNRFEQSEEALEEYRAALSEPLPHQKGKYAGFLRARPSVDSSGFMDFMNR